MSAAREPAISVLIPVLDNVGTLEQTLRAVERQTLRPAEIIAVDGGSRDGSLALLENRPGVSLLRQKGSGLANARNAAVEACKGDWLAFCDADDHWPDDSLALRYAATRHDCLAVIGQVLGQAAVESELTARQASRLGRTRTGYTPGALLIHRTTLMAVGPFDETLTIGADSDWFVRLHLSGHALACIPQVVLYKGLRQGSLSGDVQTYRKELLSVARRFVAHRKRQAGS